MESDCGVWLDYEGEQADLAAEREHIRWRSFNMNIVTFTETDRTLLGIPLLQNAGHGLNDDGQEQDKDEVADCHTNVPRR